MKKANKILTLVVIVLSIALAYLVIKFVLKKYVNVNEGNYRITDMVISSTVEVKDNFDLKLSSVSDIDISLNQNNKISFYINKSESTPEIYVDNIKTYYPNKLGQIYFSQSNVEGKKKIEEIDSLKIEPITGENEYYIELNINNEYFLENAKVPENVSEFKFDGTILNYYKIPAKDMVFTVSFNLNIKDETGNISTCKMKFSIPDERIAVNGAIVERLDLSKFNFKINN